MSDKQSPGAAGLFELPFSRRQFLKGAALAGGSLAFGSLAGACGSSSDGTSASSSASAAGTPKKGGSLRSGLVGGSAKDTLDPHVAISSAQFAATFQVYDRLMEADKDYQIVPALAEELIPNEDATVWTARLREDAMYSDGKPVTADDVIFSFNRIIDPDDPKDGAGTLSMLRSDSMKKIDDRTVEFTLETANAVFPEVLSYRQNNIVREDWNAETQIGTGPFKVVSFMPGEKGEFVPNQYYWGEGPYVDELTLLQFNDPQARVNALLGGELDHCTGVSGAQAAALDASGGVALWQSKSGAWAPFTMRIDQKPFEDVRVRQAFRLLVDREQMVEQALSGYGWVGNDMYAPYDPGYPSGLPQRSQDLEQAKSLLKQAGYDNNLTVELVTSDAVGQGAVESATVIAEQAKGAGVTVNVKKLDSGVYYGDDYLSWTFAQDYWATRNYLLQASLGLTPEAPYNETHWKNDAWLKLVREAYRTADDAKRNEMISQAATIEYEQGGFIIWSFKNLLDGYSEKLGGLVHDVWSDSSMGFRYNLVHFV